MSSWCWIFCFRDFLQYRGCCENSIAKPSMQLLNGFSVIWFLMLFLFSPLASKWFYRSACAMYFKQIQLSVYSRAKKKQQMYDDAWINQLMMKETRIMSFNNNSKRFCNISFATLIILASVEKFIATLAAPAWKVPHVN